MADPAHHPTSVSPEPGPEPGPEPATGPATDPATGPEAATGPEPRADPKPRTDTVTRSGATLHLRPHTGKLLLRGDAADQRFRAAVKKALSVAPPTEPETVINTGEAALIWRGRDAWLLVIEPGGPGFETAFRDIEERLRAALRHLHHALVDVSDNEVTFRLSGPDARSILAKGCAVDLHPRAFPARQAAGKAAGQAAGKPAGPTAGKPAGRAVQTMLAKAHVMIWYRDTAPLYDIQTRPSFAPYLRDWLVDAGQEFSIITED